MAKVYRKIVQSKYPPQQPDVLWMDENGVIKSISTSGKWENPIEEMIKEKPPVEEKPEDISSEIPDIYDWVRKIYEQDEKSVKKYAEENNKNISNLVAFRNISELAATFYIIQKGAVSTNRSLSLPKTSDLFIYDCTDNIEEGYSILQGSFSGVLYYLVTWVGKNIELRSSNSYGLSTIAVPNYEEGSIYNSDNSVLYNYTTNSINTGVQYIFIKNNNVIFKNLHSIFSKSVRSYYIDLHNYNWQLAYDTFGNNSNWCLLTTSSSSMYPYISKKNNLGDWYYEGSEGNGFRDSITPGNSAHLFWINFNEDENGKYSGTFKSNCVYNFSSEKLLGFPGNEDNGFWRHLLNKLPDNLDNVLFILHKDIMGRLNQKGLISAFVDKGVTFTTV